LGAGHDEKGQIYAIIARTSLRNLIEIVFQILEKGQDTILMTSYSFKKVFNPNPGWYAGDFHVHTDASMDGDYPPNLVAGLAQAEGLDFVAITDHNSIEGIARLDTDLDFPVLPGIEVTLDQGDFNVFGVVEKRQWMKGIYGHPKSVPLPERFQTASELFKQIAEEGLLNSINHPLLEPWEWGYGFSDLHHLHCVELWNDLYYPHNDQANPKTVELWTSWLNSGHRIVAIGGSDYHHPPRPELGLFGERLGQPTTFVYAKELSIPAILDGVRRGRVYVSRGPQLDFQATVGGQNLIIGDNLGQRSGEIEFVAIISDAPDTTNLQLVKNGTVIAEEELTGGENEVRFQTHADPAHPSWYRLEMLDEEKQALVISNPIYVNSSIL
jgi:hypothetical protein